MRGGQKFVCDAMLGSLARKLRILGFDTSYHRTGTDSELMAMALAESRIILTSDRQLWSQRGSKSGVMLIEGRSDRQRLRSLRVQSQLNGVLLTASDSRCAVCNGELRLCGREEMRERIPYAVLTRHRRFYLCRECGKVYWKGSHWSRIRGYSRLLR